MDESLTHRVRACPIVIMSQVKTSQQHRFPRVNPSKSTKRARDELYKTVPIKSDSAVSGREKKKVSSNAGAMHSNALAMINNMSRSRS